MCSAKKPGIKNSKNGKESFITNINTFFPILPPYAAMSGEAYMLWDSRENLILDINSKALQKLNIQKLPNPLPLENIWNGGQEQLKAKIKTEINKSRFPIECGVASNMHGSPMVDLFPFSHQEKRYFVLQLKPTPPEESRVMVSHSLTALNSISGFAYRVEGGIEGNIVSLQSGLGRFFPNPENWTGKPWKKLKDIIYPKDWEVYSNQLQEHIELGKTWKLSYRITAKGGDEQKWVLESGVCYRDSGNNDILEALALDITEYKAESDRYHNIAMHDGLTGLPNRILFLDRLSQSLAKARRTEWPFAVFFIDLDDFKAINDQYGHAAGDEVLIAVSDRLRLCLRETDTVARISGDEFTILLENTQHKNYSEIVAQKLQEALSVPIPLSGGPKLNLSASIGICPYFKGDNANVLLQKADSAMYMAKKSGKRRHFIYGQMLQKAP